MNRDGKLALVGVLLSYLGGIGLIALPYVVGFSIGRDIELPYVGIAAMLSFVGNCVAIAYGLRVRKAATASANWKALGFWAAALGLVGLLFSAFLLFALLFGAGAGP